MGAMHTAVGFCISVGGFEAAIADAYSQQSIDTT